MEAARYRLIERIGQGGMATVWRADDSALGRQVAVKVLLPFVAERPDSNERFAREARALAGIRHPNVLQLFDYLPAAGEEPARLIMELLAGPSLQRFVVDNGTPLPEVAGLVGVEVASGLAAVHARGIVHRDVKPENVLLDAGRVVLTDFGVARVHVAERSALTQTGAIIGSPAYMSPEQARGEEVDARSDQFSLGSLMYFLATGAAPFSGPHPLVVMQKIDRGDYVPAGAKNPRVPAWLDRVIRRLLAHDPADRFPDVGAVVAALRRGLADDGLDDASVELRRYFSDPAAYNASLPVRIAPLRLADAEAAVTRNDRTRALASIERVLQLDPAHARAQLLFERLSSRSWGKLVLAAGVLVVFAVTTPLVWSRVTTHALPVVAPAVATASPADLAEAVVATRTVAVAQDPPVPTPSAAAKADRAHAIHAVRSSPLPIAQADSAPAQDPPAAAVKVEAPREGRLSVRTAPWCELVVDGKSIGRTPQSVALSVGSHELLCLNPSGARLDRVVTIEAGEEKLVEERLTAVVELRPIALRRGDALAIDADAATAGARQVAVGRHRVSLLEGGKIVESRWLEVGPSGCALSDTPELHCERP